MLIPVFRCHPIMCVRKQMICWTKLKSSNTKVVPKNEQGELCWSPSAWNDSKPEEFLLQPQEFTLCGCTHVVKHTQGLVSIFRTSLGIWCLNLEGHFVKQISVCWKTIKTCCPCVSISVRVCVGGFISFFWTLRVCAQGGCFNFVIFLYER